MYSTHVRTDTSLPELRIAARVKEREQLVRAPDEARVVQAKRVQCHLKPLLEHQREAPNALSLQPQQLAHCAHKHELGASDSYKSRQSAHSTASRGLRVQRSSALAREASAGAMVVERCVAIESRRGARRESHTRASSESRAHDKQSHRSSSNACSARACALALSGEEHRFERLKPVKKVFL